MKVLITGVAGFIGFNFANLLLDNNHEIVGIDNLNDYYDTRLKISRLEILKKKNLKFYNLDISDKKAFEECVNSNLPTVIVNLAAQAGVRYSLTNPYPP